MLRLPDEDFTWIADTLGLWGNEREALRLRAIAGLDAHGIAKSLGVRVAGARKILAAVEERVRTHPWPRGERAWLRMLLDAMRGPRRHDPEAPRMAKDVYTGRIGDCVLRTRYPNEWDFVSRPHPKESHGNPERPTLGKKVDPPNA